MVLKARSLFNISLCLYPSQFFLFSPRTVKREARLVKKKHHTSVYEQEKKNRRQRMQKEIKPKVANEMKIKREKSQTRQEDSKIHCKHVEKAHRHPRTIHREKKTKKKMEDKVKE